MKTLFAVTRIRGPAWDAAKPLGEQEQWPEHAAFMNRLAATGFVILGGPVGEGGDVLLAVDAADEGEVEAELSADPWSRAGLLELKSIQRWAILLRAGEEG